MQHPEVGRQKHKVIGVNMGLWQTNKNSQRDEQGVRQKSYRGEIVAVEHFQKK